MCASLQSHTTPSGATEVLEACHEPGGKPESIHLLMTNHSTEACKLTNKTQVMLIAETSSLLAPRANSLHVLPLGYQLRSAIIMKSGLSSFSPPYTVFIRRLQTTPWNAEPC
jgi:hypothetical protein